MTFWYNNGNNSVNTTFNRWGVYSGSSWNSNASNDIYVQNAVGNAYLNSGSTTGMMSTVRISAPASSRAASFTAETHTGQNTWQETAGYAYAPSGYTMSGISLSKTNSNAQVYIALYGF